MAFPNKFTSFDKSILAKIGMLIIDESAPISLSKLIEMRLDKFEDISEFMLALDILYVLGKVELDESQGMISYVN